MLIYSPQDLYNKFVHEQASEAFLSKNISEESYKRILVQHPQSLYTPNYFIRIALGLLTLVSITFSSLFVGLISANLDTEGGVSIFLGLVTYIALEMLVKSKRYYNAGVDNLLIFFSAAFVVGAFAFFKNLDENLVISIVAFVVCLFLSLRFVDAFMSILSAVALFAFVFFLYLKLGTFAKATIPFLMMTMAAFVYLFVCKLSKTKRAFNYRYCCSCLMLLTMIIFYISSNYFVVKELSNEMFDLHLNLNDAIPAGWLFWGLTFVVPAGYILYGTFRKNIMFIRTGLVLTVATICTFRYYYFVVPAEVAMVLGGLILVSVSYFLMKYFKTPKYGFSFIKRESLDKDRIDLKALVIAQVSGKKANTNKALEFGGGNFGGGGAEGNY